jgi:hypothetical protein
MFLDQWFETDVLKATMSASGIIGTFSAWFPGTAIRPVAPLHGRIDVAFRSWVSRAAALAPFERDCGSRP